MKTSRKTIQTILRISSYSAIVIGVIVAAWFSTDPVKVIRHAYWLHSGQIAVTSQEQGSLGLLSVWSWHPFHTHVYRDLPQGVVMTRNNSAVIQTSNFVDTDPICCPSSFNYLSLN